MTGTRIPTPRRSRKTVRKMKRRARRSGGGLIPGKLPASRMRCSARDLRQLGLDHGEDRPSATGPGRVPCPLQPSARLLHPSQVGLEETVLVIHLRLQLRQRFEQLAERQRLLEEDEPGLPSLA